MIYEQCDIIEVNFDPTKGHDPAKTRPAIVVSSFDFNRSNTPTIVCPITSREKPFFLHRPLPDDLDVSGVIALEQIRAIDLEAWPVKKIGKLDDDFLHSILVTIRSFFDEDVW